jgi:hypothetical protein
MRTLSLGLILSVFVAAGAQAQTADSRTVSMPFNECIAIINEAAEDVDQTPVELINTGDERSVRINADDGFVTVSCSKPDNRMTLAKSAVPAAAGITASR